MNKNISIIGVGKLGLCLALNLENAGYKVLGYDLNEPYVKSLNEKTFFSYEKDVNLLLKNCSNFSVTTSFQECLQFSDIIFLMVATPSLADGKYDHSQIDSVVSTLEESGVQPGKKTLVVGCTTYPGYCSSLQERLAHLNYDVVYNPEFIAQGNIIYGQIYPDLVLIGESSKDAGDILEKVHLDLCKNQPEICRLSLTEAEVTKIAINCFITTKISFANMIGDLCNKMSISHKKVLNSVGKDSRIGNKYLKWGYGFGGPCFPRDNRVLGIVCEENGIYPSIPLASDGYNSIHLDYQLEHIKKSIVDNKITIVGVSYKPGSALIEESQQLLLAERLADSGIYVTIKDSEVVINQVKEKKLNKFTYVIDT